MDLSTRGLASDESLKTQPQTVAGGIEILMSELTVPVAGSLSSSIDGR